MSDTWQLTEPKSRVISENGLNPRRQIAETVTVGGKKYYCSLVELGPHATLERAEFMAFPLKRNGKINFGGPVYEQRFRLADKNFELDAMTWKYFVKSFARDAQKRAEREGKE